jgi:pimeloyl-ACP methyl ester carboxylesterase
MSPAATADLTDLLNDCRKQYGSKGFILLGGSGGASSAMAYACVAPDQVTGVIAMGMCDIFARLDFARKSSLPVLQKLAKTAFDAYGGTLEEVPELYRARSVLANAGKLNMPIVLTMGEKDKLIPVEETRKVAQALKDKPGFRYYEVPGGDHDSAVWVDVDLETFEIKGYFPERRLAALK